MPDTCIICNTPIPEGRMVCPGCEAAFASSDGIMALIAQKIHEKEAKTPC